jgi:hypothetical protein
MGTALSVLAQVGGGGMAWSIPQMVIIIIAVIAVIAILIAFVKYSGVQIPPIIVTVFWILLGAVVCILGVKFIVSIM